MSKSILMGLYIDVLLIIPKERSTDILSKIYHIYRWHPLVVRHVAFDGLSS